MRWKSTKLVILFIFLSLVFFKGYSSVFAQDCESECPSGDLNCLSNRISSCQEKVKLLQSQANTLSNQIAQYDAQIRLTTLKINETEEKITMLTGRIDQLEGSLVALSKAFSSRVSETYKMSRLNQSFLFLSSAPDLNTAVVRYFYLQKIQQSDRDLLIRLQSAQTTYKGEKEDQEELQQELQKQKELLDTQKKAKANLLAITKNDEKKYQQLLAQARAEYEAIQAILAGKGKEEEVGKVNQGQRIASVIQGASCNSSGSHLHFMVRQGTSALNPFNYLSGNVSYENCSGSSCGSGDGDSFNPSGSWDWPISSPIKFTQGFGSTWAIRNTWVGRIYSFHNGIDINNDGNSEVKAVRGGTLYRGSYVGYNGCGLRYVRVDHDDSDLDTLYLHINY
jgi:peptidoglycan hydrolase CwlO-like protein